MEWGWTYIFSDHSIDNGLVLQGIGGRFAEGGHEAQLHAVLLQEGFQVLLAEVHNVAGRRGRN